MPELTLNEVLRRMLDEQGVEHKDFFEKTWWEDSDGAAYIAVETRPLDNNNPSTKLMLKRTATPEQAIEATLGRGECEMEYVNDWMGWHCKSCDNLRMGLPDQKPKFCPNCGRKVVCE